MKKLTVEQYIKEFLEDRAEIIAEAKANGWYYPEMETHGVRHENGKDIYTCIGNLDYYFLKCAQFGISPKCITSLNYEANGNGYSFEYCEHDIILAVKKSRRKKP